LRNQRIYVCAHSLFASVSGISLTYVHTINSTVTRDELGTTKADIILLKDDEDFAESSTSDLRGRIQLVVAQNQTIDPEGEDYNAASGSGLDEESTLLQLQQPQVKKYQNETLDSDEGNTLLRQPQVKKYQNETLDSDKGNTLLRQPQVKKHQNETLDSTEEEVEDLEQDEDEIQDKIEATQLKNAFYTVTSRLDAHNQLNVSLQQIPIEKNYAKIIDKTQNSNFQATNASVLGQAATTQTQIPQVKNVIKPMIFNQQNFTLPTTAVGIKSRNQSTINLPYKPIDYANFVPRQANQLVYNNRLQNFTKQPTESLGSIQQFNKSNAASVQNTLATNKQQPSVASTFVTQPVRNTYVLISADANNKTTKVKLNSNMKQATAFTQKQQLANVNKSIKTAPSTLKNATPIATKANNPLAQVKAVKSPNTGPQKPTYGPWKIIDVSEAMLNPHNVSSNQLNTFPKKSRAKFNRLGTTRILNQAELIAKLTRKTPSKKRKRIRKKKKKNKRNKRRKQRKHSHKKSFNRKSIKKKSHKVKGRRKSVVHQKKTKTRGPPQKIPEEDYKMPPQSSSDTNKEKNPNEKPNGGDRVDSQGSKGNSGNENDESSTSNKEGGKVDVGQKEKQANGNENSGNTTNAGDPGKDSQNNTGNGKMTGNNNKNPSENKIGESSKEVPKNNDKEKQKADKGKDEEKISETDQLKEGGNTKQQQTGNNADAGEQSEQQGNGGKQDQEKNGKQQDAGPSSVNSGKISVSEASKNEEGKDQDALVVAVDNGNATSHKGYDEKQQKVKNGSKKKQGEQSKPFTTSK